MINHCALRNAVEKVGNPEFQERVSRRVQELCTPDENISSAVELVAGVIAAEVQKRGAAQVLKDVNLDLDQLTDHMSSAHISSC